ncbi:MAG: hypothetical protein Q4P33_02685 [Flaviflexus sp.]|nr:hypothetical protein [Flaviflexus sp.]
MRWLTRLLALALLLSGLGTAAAAKDAEDEPAWFLSEANDALGAYVDTAFPDVKPADREKLFVGRPERLARLTKEPAPRVISWDRWIAPVLLEDDPVGTLLTYREGGDRTVDVTDDVQLAGIIEDLGGSEQVVYDPLLEVFFLLGDGLISPASASAGDYLAGEVPFANFLELRAELLADKPKPTVPADEASAPVWIAVLVIVAALLALIIVIWLRHSPTPEERTEPRPARHVRIYRRGDTHARTRH